MLMKLDTFHFRYMSITTLRISFTCYSYAPLNNPFPNSALLNKKIFGKTLQTLARGRNRPLGLRCGRLMTIFHSLQSNLRATLLITFTWHILMKR